MARSIFLPSPRPGTAGLRCAELGIVGFIIKPFELQVIVAKLQSLLS